MTTFSDNIEQNSRIGVISNLVCFCNYYDVKVVFVVDDSDDIVIVIVVVFVVIVVLVGIFFVFVLAAITVVIYDLIFWCLFGFFFLDSFLTAKTFVCW